MIEGDYKKAFFEAKIFLDVAELIHNKSNTVDLENAKETFYGYRFAEYVNHSFAIELLFKTILLKENGQHNTGHDLLDLFKELSQNAKNKITESIARLSRINQEANDSTQLTPELLLSERNKPFTYFRYRYETDNKLEPAYHLDPIADSLCNYLTSEYPEFNYVCMCF